MSTTTSISALQSTLPSTMRALIQPSVHSPTLKLTDLPLPTPSPTEHLIRVHTAAITNNELNWEKNFPDVPVSTTKQPIPCYDLAGTIISPVPGSQFKPGDEVWACMNFYLAGCAAEYAVAQEHELALRTRRLTWAESATVPMSALTAWQALFVQAGWKAEEGAEHDKRVFVTAASGGVGTWVVQLAKWAGAYVIGTCGKGNIDRVKDLGADEVLDYREVDVKTWAAREEDEDARKVDLVIDCAGKKSLEDAWWSVKDEGILISVAQYPETARPSGVDNEAKRIKAIFFVVEREGSQLAQITKLINRGKFVPALDSVYPLEKYEEALEKLEHGKTRGKIVFDLGVKD